MFPFPRGDYSKHYSARSLRKKKRKKSEAKEEEESEDGEEDDDDERNKTYSIISNLFIKKCA